MNKTKGFKTPKTQKCQREKGIESMSFQGCQAHPRVQVQIESGVFGDCQTQGTNNEGPYNIMVSLEEAYSVVIK